MIQHILQFGLTVKQVKELCEPQKDSNDVDINKPEKHALQLVKIMRNVKSTTPDDLARALMYQEDNIDLARAHLQSMRRLLDEAEKHL